MEIDDFLFVGSLSQMPTMPGMAHAKDEETV